MSKILSIKKYLKIFLPVMLCLMLIAVGFQSYRSFADRQVREHQASIGKISNRTHGFTYLGRNDSFQTFAFSLPTVREVQVNAWTMNLFGNVSSVYVKILAGHDQTDYHFYTYWNYETFRDKRPYKYVSVIEQEATHQ